MGSLKRILLVMLLGLVSLSMACQANTGSQGGSTNTTSGGTNTGEVSFANPKKSAHYESNTPAHGAVLAGVPINVVIDFNFDLAKPSAISIKKDGKEFGVGKTQIDDNKLVMRRDMDTSTPDGVYTVEYRACWPDGSCHDGSFQFAIDRDEKDGFEDQRNKNEVAVDLVQFSIKPQNLTISQGAKLTWTNRDDVEHFVNTDSHPTHTYFPDQNSRGLKNGDTFSVVFDKPGIYPYHCSAHPDTMSGMILVESR